LRRPARARLRPQYQPFSRDSGRLPFSVSQWAAPYHTEQGKCMDIVDWRMKIDELDRQIVALISARAHAAQEIGKLKRSTSMPVYEPNRERVIFENVRAAN